MSIWTWTVLTRRYNFSYLSCLNNFGALFFYSELNFIVRIFNVAAKAFLMLGFIIRHCCIFNSFEVLKQFFVMVISYLAYYCIIHHQVQIRKLQQVITITILLLFPISNKEIATIYVARCAFQELFIIFVIFVLTIKDFLTQTTYKRNCFYY